MNGVVMLRTDDNCRTVLSLYRVSLTTVTTTHALHAKRDWIREIFQSLDDRQRHDLRGPRVGSRFFAHNVNFNLARRTFVINMQRYSLAIRDELHHRRIETCSSHCEHRENVRILHVRRTHTHTRICTRDSKRQVLSVAPHRQ